MTEALFGPPDKLRIPREGPVDYVGRLEDGTQYMAFVSGAFPDGYVMNQEWRKVKEWLGVVHLFDAEGNHLRSDARLGGHDIDGWEEACNRAWEQVHQMFTPLRTRNPQPGDIFVRPFSVVLGGVTHALRYQVDQYEEGGPVFESVMLDPKDIMFHPPWDSGEWSS